MSGGIIHAALQAACVRWLKRQQDGPHRRSGCPVVVTDIETCASETPDVIGWNSMISVLVECKASRADFFRDAKKPHRIYSQGIGNRRYYAAPEGLLKLDEIPEEWGLLEMDQQGKINATKEAVDRALNRDSLTEERRIFVSIMRRAKA